MTTAGWVQALALVVLLAVSVPFLGSYMAKVYGEERRAPGDRFFLPVERFIYRLCGVDPEREQRWNIYAISVLAFSAASILFLYLLERVQEHLPVNPTQVKGVPAPLAFNTAVSFTTNTNWQNYSGESTMSHLTQMAGLAVQNFASAAVGIAVAIALVRGIVRRRQGTLGNFWVDITRTVTRILVPVAIAFGVFFISQGVVQNLHGYQQVKTVEGTTQQIPAGPVASQEVIKEFGTNGGGFYNANSAHPFENPNPLTNLAEMYLLLVIPFSLAWTFGKMAKDKKQGYAVLAAMVILWVSTSAVVMVMETNGNPKLDTARISQQVTATQSGGNLEGKETRFGPAASGLFASSTTHTSTGAVISSHDSFTPAGGMMELVNMMFGEVSPGGTGSGLYGMLVFAILAMFIAGLMVGRTPEYLGKKIQGPEVKIAVVYLLAVPLVILCFAGASVVMNTPVKSILNPGPHGLTEVVYGYTSTSNNNGSAFAGLSGNTNWFNTTFGICMLVGRFILMIGVLAIAGSLVRKQRVPSTAGTFPTGTPLFAGLLVSVIVVVVGLTFLPVLALGPIVEQLKI
jgi:potassium-transporting ATPase potassium-binding subunit